MPASGCSSPRPPPYLRSITGEVILPGCDGALLDHQVLAFHHVRQWIGVAPPLYFPDPPRGDRHLAFVAHHPVFLLAIPKIRPEAAVARVEGGMIPAVGALQGEVVERPPPQFRLQEDRLPRVEGFQGDPHLVDRLDHARNLRRFGGGLLENVRAPSGPGATSYGRGEDQATDHEDGEPGETPRATGRLRFSFNLFFVSVAVHGSV